MDMNFLMKSLINSQYYTSNQKNKIKDIKNNIMKYKLENKIIY